MGCDFHGHVHGRRGSFPDRFCKKGGGTDCPRSRPESEKAPGVGMDRAEIKEKGLTIQTPAGTFKNCIKMEETNPLEPNAKDYKIYAPGVGMIKDGDMPLVEIRREEK